VHAITRSQYEIKWRLTALNPANQFIRPTGSLEHSVHGSDLQHSPARAVRLRAMLPQPCEVIGRRGPPFFHNIL
jgi:hypothetical protein